MFPGTPPAGLAPVLLIALYLALGLLPLVLAAVQAIPARGFAADLSAGLAMAGFAMLLAEFLLSGRFRQLSGKVGIDLTLRFHQLAALALLLFLLAHPLLYALPALERSPQAAIGELRGLFAAPALWSGVVAWWLLIALIAAAWWRDRLPIRYEVWRASHGVGAGLIAVLGAHHTLAVGSHAADPLMAGVWVVLTAVALGSLGFVYGVKPFLRRRAPYRVIANAPAAARMWRVAVAPEQGPAMDFAAGQFAWVNLGHGPFSLTEHPFSISSAPADRPEIAFTIKESGDFTNGIGQVPVGTRAYLDGPHGTFTPAGRPACPLVLIGGGVGFAPHLGILRQLAAERWPLPVTVIYGNRVADQILCRAELDRLAQVLDLRLHLVLSEPPEGWDGPVGELTPEVLRICLADRDPAALYFVCGPPPMLDVVERGLISLGVPAGRIVSERFSYG